MAKKASRKKASKKAAKSPARKAKVRKTKARKAAGKARPTAKKAKPKSVPKRTKTASKTVTKPVAVAVPTWTTADITEAFRRLRDATPEPKTELQYVNPFTLLVAVVLSAQATDAGVNKATPALFAAADTPATMAALGEDQVRDLIKTIGLFRTKAKNVVALSRILVEQYGGEVPRSREALEALPGVGRKTANVVLNVAFGEPTIAVDTHIFRVGNRTGIAPGKTPLEVEQKLEQAIPDEFKRHAHHWLILHGRYTCIARKPLCERCVIADLCKWPEKTVAA
ncbi:MAG: endonuclease III [Pseudolabrys sp.]|jgi:endonuclease-3